jgi:hypothetical protein
MAGVGGTAMKPWIWLRVAALLQALGTVGHAIATATTAPTHGSEEQAVFDAMRSFHFNMMEMRSTWDLSRLSVVDDGKLRNAGHAAVAVEQSKPHRASTGLSMVLTILVAQTLSTILGWKDFFAGPGVVGSLIALSLAIAVIGLCRDYQPALPVRRSVNA